MENGEQPARPTGLELTPQVYLTTSESQIVGAYDEILRRKGVKQEGLSKREVFAMAAMQGILGNLAIADKGLAEMQRQYYVKEYPGKTEFEVVALESVKMADSLLKALSNKKP